MKTKLQYEKEVEKWISDKINGHGGAYYMNDLGLWHIDYIGSTSSIKVAFYNVMLFFKFITKVTRKD